MYTGREHRSLQKHNPYFFYQLSKALQHLSALPPKGGPVIELFEPLYNARTAVGQMLDQPGALPPSSRRLATTILKTIDDFAAERRGEQFAILNKNVDSAQIARVKKTVSDFETVLANESADLEVFIVAAKGIYSTTSLIENAEESIRCTLSHDSQFRVPDQVYKDFNQAGRCLAFEVPTASGFHSARAVEAIVKVYWAAVTQKSVLLAPMMNNCIDEMKKRNENPRVLELLNHVRELHRNTIMHPETFLTMNEALRLFDIAKSAISAVAERIEELSGESSDRVNAEEASL